MASPSARLVTAMLGTLAGWALLTALSAYFGLGGRYTLHPDDPSLEPPLPELKLTATQERLDPVESYAEVSSRPLFNLDRRPLPVEVPAGPETAAVEPPPPPPLEVTLTGVILTSQVSLAMVSDNRDRKEFAVKLGANLEGDQSAWRLVKLEPRKAVFAGPTGESEVELRVFDGTGGQSPTPMAPPVAVPNPMQATGVVIAPDIPDNPESRAEMIRQRIEERRRQMREEAARASEGGG